MLLTFFTQLSRADSDLYAVLDGGSTGSGRTEVHVLSQSSNYQTFTDHVATPLGLFGPNAQFILGNFAGGTNPDLFTIIASGSTGSGRTEVHVLSGDSNYQTFSLHVATPFPLTTPGNVQFMLGRYSSTSRPDLFIILSGGTTGSGNAEVHILSGDSYYQSYALHAALPFGLTPAGTAQFMIGRFASTTRPDLYVVLASGSTGSGRAEVHVLSGDAYYQSYSLHIATPFPLSAVGATRFSLGDSGAGSKSDLIATLHDGSTGSGHTENHIMSGDSYYQSYTDHVATPLGLFPASNAQIMSSVGACTDPAANNFDFLATKNDGSCTYTVYGCTDPTATNYNSLANTSDNSCTYPQPTPPYWP